jgi:hypothetical protein
MNKPKLTREVPAWANVIKFIKEGGSIDDVAKKYDISEVKDEILREAV